MDLPADFVDRFCLETLPHYYRNHPDANFDYGPMHDPTELCMPAPWCEEPTLIAYSRNGFTEAKWPLPPEWSGVSEVQISRLSVDGPQPRNRVAVEPNGIRFSLAAGEAVCVTRVEG